MEYTYYSLEKATLIKVDGTLQELIPKGKIFTYNEIQRVIREGCLIQPIQLRHWTNHKDFKKMNFICDEEGMINGSKRNEKASKLLKNILGPNAQDLYGNVIFLPNKLYKIRLYENFKRPRLAKQPSSLLK